MRSLVYQHQLVELFVWYEHQGLGIGTRGFICAHRIKIIYHRVFHLDLATCPENIALWHR